MGSLIFDPKTITPTNVVVGKYGSVEIIKQDYIYLLNHNDTVWHRFNTKNMREYAEQWSSYDLAYGDVLITGFGFGQLATWLAGKPKVKSVTVLEISQDVVNAFLANNEMPANIEVIITDAYQYRTDKHYDCIIIDHISDGPKPDEFLSDLTAIGNNIPNHDLFWFWSIEFYYITKMHGITYQQLYVNPIDFAPFDFGAKWEKFRLSLLPTVPALSKEKLDSYIGSFFLRYLIQ